MDKLISEYGEEILKRKKTSRAYTSHQLTGLIIADMLEDRTHKSLYIKLAKKHSNQILLGLAKDISTRKNVNNKGAYFMHLLKEKDILGPRSSKEKSK